MQYKMNIKHYKSMNHYAAKKLTKATAKIEQDYIYESNYKNC